MNDNKNTVTKIFDDKFLPLVEGVNQIVSDDDHRYSLWDKQDQPEHFNSYVLNDIGELVSLHLTKVDIINWELISSCSSLRKLTIIRSEILEIPDAVLKMPSLVELDFSSNRISTLPVFSNFNKNIKELILHGNNIVEINDSVWGLSKLNTLILSDNNIFEVSDKIKKLQNLMHLNLSGNDLEFIPEGIGELKKLVNLQLESNKITKLPSSIGLLKNLQVLFVSDNKIKKIPDEISSLSNIRFMIFDGNELEEIPEVIGGLNVLSSLSLDNNKIKVIPKTMIKMEVLSYLSLVNNPLPIPDPSFHNLTAQEQIQTLLEIQQSTTMPLKQAKILVVGDERVGKTSIINRLLGNPHHENQTSTQGIDIYELSFDSFDTNIWDFAGQELTHQTHQFFLTERSLYIYVLDAQKEDNQARDLHWLNTIKSYSENSPIIIVANHFDQNVNYHFDKLRYQENFQIVDVIYTSACNLNSLTEGQRRCIGDSINKLNQAITRQLPQLPGIKRKLPESWHKVKRAMEVFKQEQNVIDKDTYELECIKNGVIGKPLQSALLKILNSIGTVVAYPNDFRLRMTQILKPEWVTNAVYKIVRSQSKVPGIYSEEAIGEILNGEYTYTHQQWLVDLLIKFELGFRLFERNELLIPMRLPSVMPEFSKSYYQQGLNIRFNYHRIGLLKLNVLPQLIVRMHQYIDENTTKYWRNGMFLRLKRCQGVIIADEPNQCIEVYLTNRDDEARNLLQWLRSNLEKIEQSQVNASQNKTLPYKEEVALFDDDSNVVGYVDYQRIERAFRNGKEEISLEIKNLETGEVDDHDFNVASLLGLYQRTSKQNLEITGVIHFLVRALLRLTDVRAKVIDEGEDDINDRLRESLISGGYSIKDQSRGGFSGSGEGVGERDLILLDEYGQQATIIEAMILTSAVKSTISSHFEKLVNNYNTQGNKFDFLVTYAKVKNFNGLWRNYIKHLESVKDMTENFSNKLNVKVGISQLLIEDSEQTRKIIHIMVNLGVKP
ncbi:COR domain-containing protein [Shewanella scandinavica]|uniref:COR domain-containing protein n=1 Tax=Shewanella scandinavica TaxID=3063538 RepID=UPI003191836A